ncbi:MAG: Mut7-C ubiquitin/RNAse domain-containing protein [Bacteroidota bacterium]|nr:Mut7-C ubiquitin/RNAse domain-containing protein [Bacteroidota bacterium]
MAFTCTFYIHKNLNDFLPVRSREQRLTYTFHPSATVKDAIEAIGVPHVEVSQISRNGQTIPFSYLLQPNDTIEVVPFDDLSIRDEPVAFVLDVHLGKLARLLRLLGIDAHYENGYKDPEIVALAVRENKTVLTRDVGLLKYKVLQHGYWLRSQHPEEQLREVLKRFALNDTFQPFSRCIACNGTILSVPKETVIQHLPPNTKEFFHEFYRCSQCGKVYWKGSHYENMVRRIQHIRLLAGQV